MPTLEEISPEPIKDDGSVMEEVVETTDPEPEVEEKNEDVINVLVPKAEPAPVELSYGGRTEVYVQKPLTYFGKMEFMEKVGETLDKAMKDDAGLTVKSLFGDETPTAVSLSASDFSDLDSFLSLVSKVARYAPDFLKESYLIWLRVKPVDRAWAREALENLSDEQGIEIIERFIDQNWEALNSFFTVRIAALFRRVQNLRKNSEEQQ